MTDEKYVITVKIERVVHDQPAADGSVCRTCKARQPCRCLPPKAAERKVDTVASVVVTAATLDASARKAKAHIDAEMVDYSGGQP